MTSPAEARSWRGARIRVRGLGWLVSCMVLHAQAAYAQPSRAPDVDEDLATVVADAQAALDAGEYQRALDRLEPVLVPAGGPDEVFALGSERSDRAESWRLYGLALFSLGRYDPARIAFLEYLKLDVDARLDPSLFPPETIAFFEDVRARNAAEVRKYRPRPGRKRIWALNLIPPAGQFQNGHHTKAWIIAGLGTLAIASNIGTYITLRTWCDPATGVCRSGEESREGEARVLRTVNLASGGILVGVLAYGVIDGFLGYRAKRESSPTITWMPMPDGGGVMVLGSF